MRYLRQEWATAENLLHDGSTDNDFLAPFEHDTVVGSEVWLTLRAIENETVCLFGREDGQPVQREQAYAVSAEDLNTLGTIVQSVSGRAALVTVEEMIYWLERAKFVPQGNALSSNTMGWRMVSTAAGTNLEA